jgi:RNA polymerase sigma-70 factor (ECF subfamily)
VDPHDRFRELIASYGAAMRRLCAVSARGQHDREDLFQNIFLAIWKAMPSYRGDASERTWVYSIAHNVAATWRAREGR